MSRLISPLVVLVLLGLGTGFAGAQDDQKDKKDVKKTEAATYYPIEVGNTWVYRVNANGNPSKVTTRISKYETLAGEKLARLESPNVLMTEHIRVTDKGIFRVRFNGAEVNPPFQLLALPLKVGAKWKGDCLIGKGPAMLQYSATIEAKEKVEVPAGKYETIRVRFKLMEKGQESETVYWFSRDIGFVKQTFNVAGNSILLELESFTKKK